MSCSPKPAAMFYVLRSSGISESTFFLALMHLQEHYFAAPPRPTAPLPTPSSSSSTSHSPAHTADPPSPAIPQPLHRPRAPTRFRAIPSPSFLDLPELWSWILAAHNEEWTPTYDWDTLLLVDTEDWKRKGFGMLSVRADLTGFRGVGRLWVGERGGGVEEGEHGEEEEHDGEEAGESRRRNTTAVRYSVDDWGDTSYNAPPPVVTSKRSREPSDESRIR